MQTVAQFAEACNYKSHDEIYELFEDGISQELRDAIYMLSDPACSEPARDALNRIGTFYGVQALVDY